MNQFFGNAYEELFSSLANTSNMCFYCIQTWNGLVHNTINVFIMQIDYVKISCKEDVHICRTNFAKNMEQNLYERTSQQKMYGKQLFLEDLEV